jgi:uncharacterized protein
VGTVSTGFVVDRNVAVPMRDGVELRADVYRHSGGAPAPAILNVTPYNKELLYARENPLEPVFSAPDRGFAYVRVDCRGRYASAGDYLPYADTEATDGYDCVEWLAAQSWCSGEVAMLGVSYEAGIQLRVAALRPPHLRAIAPIMGGTWERGFLPLDFGIWWCAMMAADSLQRVPPGPDRDHDLAVVTEALRDPGAVASHLPLRDHPLANLRTVGAPSFVDVWGEHEDPGPVRLAATVPGLFLTGWYDCGAANIVAQWRQFRELGLPAARSGSSLVLGPWRHGKHLTDDLGDVHFGFFAMPFLSGATTVDWWTVENHYWAFFAGQLGRGRDRPAAPVTPAAPAHITLAAPVIPEAPVAPVAYFVMGANTWRTAPDWPPSGTVDRELYLGSGGHANSAAGDGWLRWTAPGVDGGADHYDYDPLRPVPSFGGRFFHRGGSAGGPFDQARIERRDDVLVYTSDPLAEPLEVAGDVRLELYASSSAPETDFMVKLCAVDPAGISLNLADGQLRTRYRDGTIGPPLRPGEIYRFAIDLGPTAYRFAAGHRIRVQVTSSAFPFYDRNLNTGGDPRRESTAVVARQAVHHHAAAPSRIHLPVSPPC